MSRLIFKIQLHPGSYHLSKGIPLTKRPHTRQFYFSTFVPSRSHGDELVALVQEK